MCTVHCTYNIVLAVFGFWLVQIPILESIKLTVVQELIICIALVGMKRRRTVLFVQKFKIKNHTAVMLSAPLVASPFHLVCLSFLLFLPTLYFLLPTSYFFRRFCLQNLLFAPSSSCPFPQLSLLPFTCFFLS